MSAEVFKSGEFKGVSVNDAFAVAATQQEPVVVKLGAIPWPAGLEPTAASLGNYSPGQKITGPLQANADVLIILYTQLETQALLDVFTHNNEWTAARKKKWCGYAHNFEEFKSRITNISGDTGLEDGLFGYLSAMTIGTKTVVFYKSELHPKQNGTQLVFVPVIQQLLTELKPSLVLSTGTAGAIGSTVQCGDVTVTTSARFHCEDIYPNDPEINTMSSDDTELTNNPVINPQYLTFAATNLTKLSLEGLSKCYSKLQEQSGFAFVKENIEPPGIYVTSVNPVPGPQPMAIVSADYLTVDDSLNSEGLQSLGIMNDTDDAFVFYAISKLAGTQPDWISVRNASEPQIVTKAFPPGTSPAEINSAAKSLAGSIYGIYQYCTTLNSALACWGIVAGM